MTYGPLGDGFDPVYDSFGEVDEQRLAMLDRIAQMQQSYSVEAATTRQRIHHAWTEQRTYADMILSMAPIQFDPGSRDRHVAQFSNAVHHMRQADIHRVMNMTGLKSPF